MSHRILSIGAADLFGRLSFEHVLGRCHAFTGPNEAGKSTRLGIPDLVTNGGRNGVFPVVGRPTSGFRAWMALEHDSGRVTLERGWDGRATVCRIDGVKVGVRDFDARCAELVGSAGVWRLSDLTSLSPSDRLGWIERELMAGGEAIGPWFTEALVEAIGNAKSWALPELEDVSPGAPATADDVQRLRRGTRDLLAEHDLTEALRPRGKRYKVPPMPKPPADGALARTLVVEAGARVRLMKRIARQALDAAKGAVKRATDAGRVEGLPAGTVAEWRDKAERIARDIAASERELAEADAAHVAREGVQESLDAAQKELDRLRSRHPSQEYDASRQELATLTEVAAQLGATAAAKRTELEAAARALAELEAEVDAAVEGMVVVEAKTSAAQASRDSDHAARAAGSITSLFYLLTESYGAVPDNVRADPRFTRALEVREELQPDPERIAKLEADTATANDRLEAAKMRRDAARRRHAAAVEAEAGARQANDAKRREIKRRNEDSARIRARVDRYDEDVAAARQRVAGIRHKLDGMPTGANGGLLEEQIGEMQRLHNEAVANADTLSDYTQARASLERARSDRNMWDARHKACAAMADALDNLLGRVLEKQLGPVLSPASSITQAVLERDLSLSLSDGGASFLLGKVDLDGVKGDQLRSPRIVALSALRVAVLRSMPGLRVLAVDDLEAITTQRRTAFLEALVREVDAGHLSQAMGAVALESVPDMPDGWTVTDLGA